MTVHEFETTSDAYGACQCDENIHDGDLLVIKEEQVVGVADTWPIAVTKVSGELHNIIPGHVDSFLITNPKFVEPINAARAKAIELGFELDW